MRTRLIERIDRFIARQGRVPEEREVDDFKRALGLEVSERCVPCYVKNDGEHAAPYTVWFGTTLGESYAYDPRARACGSVAAEGR